MIIEPQFPGAEQAPLQRCRGRVTHVTGDGSCCTGLASVSSCTECGRTWPTRFGVFHDAVEVAGEVALEDAGGVACALAFCDSAGDVVAARGVVLTVVEDDRVQGAVELAITRGVQELDSHAAASS
jgi:hypothetical protein